MRLRAEIYRQDEHVATVWGDVVSNSQEFVAHIHRLEQVAWASPDVTVRQAEDELCLLAEVSAVGRAALRWVRPQLMDLELCQECGSDAEHPEADCARCQSAREAKTKREAREKAELEARLGAEPTANDVEF